MTSIAIETITCSSKVPYTPDDTCALSVVRTIYLPFRLLIFSCYGVSKYQVTIYLFTYLFSPPGFRVHYRQRNETRPAPVPIVPAPLVILTLM